MIRVRLEELAGVEVVEQSRAMVWLQGEAERRVVNRIRWSSQPSKAENNLWSDPATKAATTTSTDGFFRLMRQDDTTRTDFAEVERSVERPCRSMRPEWPPSGHLPAVSVAIETLPAVAVVAASKIAAAAVVVASVVVVAVVDCCKKQTGPDGKEVAAASG